MLISAYSTRLEFVPHDFTPVDGHFRWHESGEQDAGFAASLSELEDYVSRAGVGQPAETVRLLIGHVRDTQRSYSFTLDGADPAQLARLTAWATEANAILVAEGALLDPAGRPLLAGAHGAPTGKVPLTPESTERAQTIRSWLASAHGLQIPGDLPPVRSAAETRTRDVSDVGLRIIGLVMTSDFASSVIAGSPLNQRAMQAVFPHAMAALPPTERELFNRRETGAARKLQRRIEAANELLWAAGRTTLGWPTTDCHPTQVKDLVLRRGEQGFLDGLRLRGTNELLDEYECLSSLMWALNNQEALRPRVYSDADPRIVAQRLIALEWLLKPQLAWDDAQG
ncbi:MAG: DUF4272 domain-containing protein [Propionibacterium sp.]|jgi:hypothetical protein|nr:DUF4272 domain-containing protein [Propionibacterium sp.]